MKHIKLFEGFLNESESDEILTAIFSPNNKKGKIDTEFGSKTSQGLKGMLDNDSYSSEEIAKAIFNNNEKSGKIETGYGSKTLEGLVSMIDKYRKT